MTDSENESERRYRGILTPEDRAFLRGEKELSENARRNARYRIRQRVTRTLRDFELLYDGLSDSDRQQIITKLAKADPAALTFMMAFLYTGMDDLAVHIDEEGDSSALFKQLIDDAICIAEQNHRNDRPLVRARGGISKQSFLNERFDLSQGQDASSRHYCNSRSRSVGSQSVSNVIHNEPSGCIPESPFRTHVDKEDRAAELSREWLDISGKGVQSIDHFGC